MKTKQYITKKGDVGIHPHVDMTGARYLLALREKQDLMKREILNLCRSSKGMEAIPAAEIYKDFQARYPQGKNTGEENVILRGVLGNLLSGMVSHGQLAEEMTGTGAGYRIPALSGDKSEAA